MYFNHLPPLPDFKNARILVIGDVMLDRYVHGTVDRISPESPVPILKISHTNSVLGGAGNVVRNLRALGCQVNLMSIIGDDENGRDITRILQDDHVPPDSLIIDTEHPTIVKSRYVSGMHQLLRVDAEVIRPPTDEQISELHAHLDTYLETADVIILSDYGKGILTDALISHIIFRANELRKPVLVDPKGRNFTKYKGAYLITPNKKELSEAMEGRNIKNDSDVQEALTDITSICELQNAIVTRSAEGMSLYEPQSDQKFHHFTTTAKDVFDVSGAGDTVIAVIAAGLATGMSLPYSVALSNLAGGIVVGKLGTATIYKSELEHAISSINDTSSPKQQTTTRRALICTWDETLAQVETWRKQSLTIGFTNGSFDILHPGHVTYLNASRDRCDKLIVALNTDASIQRYKGADRPVNPLQTRMDVIAALGSVDLVVSFGAKPEEEDKPLELISLLKPDLYFKGGDYTLETLPETPLVHGYGGRVEIIPFKDGHSTTGIIQKMKTPSPKDNAA